MKGNCAICGTEIEIQICCNDMFCGCQGLPVEPPVCSEKCYNEFMAPKEPRKDQPFHLES